MNLENKTGHGKETEQVQFYKDELRKRDDIVMFLCEKMKGMESKINLLTKQYQYNDVKELSYDKISGDFDKDHMLSPQNRNQVLSSDATFENTNDFIKLLGNMMKPGSRINGADATMSSN